MKLTWHEGTDSEMSWLAEWNYQLIHDEDHRNPMSVEQLGERMKKWVAEEYRAVIFTDDDPVAYALFKQEEALIYLRQLFVRRDRRGQGIGHAAIEILRREIWPAGVRLTVDVLCRNVPGIAFWRSVGCKDYCLTLEIMP